ncbi:MAG: hypothetical protein ACO3Q7_13190 [Steroidobacteraceae bacterium]
MAITPATFNFTIWRRADYPFAIEIADSEDAPLILSGWSAALELWNEQRTRQYGSATLTIADPASGTISGILPRSLTETLPRFVSYDLKLTNPNGLEEYYLNGVITVEEGYTA